MAYLCSKLLLKNIHPVQSLILFDLPSDWIQRISATSMRESDKRIIAHDVLLVFSTFLNVTVHVRLYILCESRYAGQPWTSKKDRSITCS